MSGFVLAVLACLVLANAQTCNTGAATTCVSTATSCLSSAGSSIPAVCACYRTYISCLTAAGCCSDPSFGSFCTTATNYINSNCGTATSGSCFHKDTVITYGTSQLSMADLDNHAECAIPHVVTARGVIVTAHCSSVTKTLRLTAGHLVYSKRGLQAAKDLTTQDTIFADIDEKQPCSVVSVTHERELQEYFGLNCHVSQVLASGLKSSTFEKLHSIPSFWMSVMGRILGIKRASRIGDQIEQLVAKMNLI